MESMLVQQISTLLGTADNIIVTRTDCKSFFNNIAGSWVAPQISNVQASCRAEAMIRREYCRVGGASGDKSRHCLRSNFTKGQVRWCSER